MVITNETSYVNFTDIVHTRAIFDAHVRDIVLDTEKETISVAIAGCKNPYSENFILIDFNKVTTPVEATVSALYDTILGYFTD